MRDGLTIKKAIKILAKNTKEGINAEYSFMCSKVGKFTLLRQALLEENGKQYDAMTIMCNSGPKIFYFDVTDFFGK